jgi:hypothetical protein
MIHLGCQPEVREAKYGRGTRDEGRGGREKKLAPKKVHKSQHEGMEKNKEFHTDA